MLHDCVQGYWPSDGYGFIPPYCYANWGEEGPGSWNGYPYPEIPSGFPPSSYVGFDLTTPMPWPLSVPQGYAKQLGQGVSEYAQSLGSKARDVSHGVSKGLADTSSTLSNLNQFGDTAAKAGMTADAATSAMKQHEETMRVIKYVVIGMGVLGGAALIYTIAK